MKYVAYSLQEQKSNIAVIHVGGNDINHRSKKAATGRVMWKKLFLKILQIIQENTCVGDSF